MKLRIRIPTARVTGKVLGVSTRPPGSSAVRVALATQYQEILMWVTTEPDGTFEFPKGARRSLYTKYHPSVRTIARRR